MELDRQKIYIISGVVGLVIVMVIGFFYYNSVVSKNKLATTTGTGPSTSGSGGLGTLPPLQTTTPPTRPSPPVLHTDASQPYATILPRESQPAPSPTPVATSTAPVQPTPAQAVNSAGMDSSMAFQYNDLASLTEDQLMAKYDPNYQSVEQNFTPPPSSVDGIAANGTDGVVTVPATPPLTSIPTVPLPNGVTFTVNQENDPQSLQNYLTTLSSTVAPFDISNPNNSSLVSSAVTDAISNPAKYKADLAAGKSMLTQIQALPVPSDLAGLQDSYYNLYSQYVTLVGDAGSVSSSNQTTAVAADSAVQQDAAQFGSSLETTLNDLNDSQTVVQNAASQ